MSEAIQPKCPIAQNQQFAVNSAHLTVDLMFLRGVRAEIQCNLLDGHIAGLNDMVSRAFDRANFHPEARP